MPLPIPPHWIGPLGAGAGQALFAPSHVGANSHRGFGVEPHTMELGMELSSVVSATIPELCALVAREVGDAPCA